MERCDKPAYWIAKNGMFLCDSCQAKENPNHFKLIRFTTSIGDCDKPVETLEQFRKRGVPGKSTDWRKVNP